MRRSPYSYAERLPRWVFWFRALFALVSTVSGVAVTETAQVEVNFSGPLGSMRMDQMGLGQGGLADEPMWADRIAEIRALRPRLIRLFIQQYFDLLPQPGAFHFETLDRSVDTVLKTGASPLMCLCFKPPLLFPQINQDIVEPVDYVAWEELVSKLVSHYLERGGGIRYWEIANEPDIGEDGGCPYRFKPENYVRYYHHTAAAILRADPNAHIGGPALANYHSAILPALLSFCQTNSAPLQFVSWHIYSSDPIAIRRTTDYVLALLKEYHGPKPETILDEWNMDLMNPSRDPQFQPCFIAETIWQMKEASLDYSCYYHIRDWHVSPDKFASFMSERGTAFMTRWWNRMPQYDGLFDYQNQVRPAYFAFKLMSRLAGQRLALSSSHFAVHGFATHDEQLRMYNLLLWNFSNAPVQAELLLKGLPGDMRVRHLILDATTANSDENARLRFEPMVHFAKGDQPLSQELGPYAVHYWSFE